MKILAYLHSLACSLRAARQARDQAEAELAANRALHLAAVAAARRPATFVVELPGRGPHRITQVPDGRFIISCEHGEPCILRFRLDGSATLTPIHAHDPQS